VLDSIHSLMIADNSLWHGLQPAESDRRPRYLYGGYEVQEAGLERRSTISHPLIRGSSRMTLFRLGLPLSRWRAPRLMVETRAPRHCPASSAAYRAEADVGCCDLLSWLPVKLMSCRLWDEPCRRSTR
jgi:hypothetical protein